jgi:hypothetical protein
VEVVVVVVVVVAAFVADRPRLLQACSSTVLLSLASFGLLPSAEAFPSRFYLVPIFAFARRSSSFLPPFVSLAPLALPAASFAFPPASRG